MERTPEYEIMNVPERAQAYADADFADVNQAFVERLCELVPARGVLHAVDLGTGPADIPSRVALVRPEWRIAAVDGSWPMLLIAHTVTRPFRRIGLVQADASRTPFADRSFDVVFSNSILHHVDEITAFWREVRRLARRGGYVFVRDLIRPRSPDEARDLVGEYAGGEHPLLQEDFYNSLLAAYRVDEVRAQLDAAGLEPLTVEEVSDRHLDVWGRL